MSLPGPKNHHFLTNHFLTKTFTPYYESPTKPWGTDIPPTNHPIALPPLAKDFPAQCHADVKLDPAWSHVVLAARDLPAQRHADFKLDPAWSHVALAARTGTAAQIYVADQKRSIVQRVILLTTGGPSRKKNKGRLLRADDRYVSIDWHVTIDPMASLTIGLCSQKNMILVLKKTGPQSVVGLFGAIYSLSDLIAQLGKKRSIIHLSRIVDTMADLGIRTSWRYKKRINNPVSIAVLNQVSTKDTKVPQSVADWMK
jgi:hypothetical protein